MKLQGRSSVKAQRSIRLGLAGLALSSSLTAGAAAASPADAASFCRTHFGVFVPEKSAGVVSLWARSGSTVTIRPNQYSRIWAGVWGTGTNGPPGWVDLAPWGDGYPLPGRNVYSLVFRISNNNYPVTYRYAGYWTSYRNTGNSGFVVLRTNDNAPGNGSGAFIADVTVCDPAT